MKFRVYTDDGGNERISAWGVIEPGGFDTTDRQEEPSGEPIGVVESAEAREDGLYATVRIGESPEE